jgi:hypothetical protein
MKTLISKRSYNWGTLRIIQKGVNFSVVIHPEHYAKIANLVDGQSTSFREETGRDWKVRREGSALHFEARGIGKVTVEAEALA